MGLSRRSLSGLRLNDCGNVALWLSWRGLVGLRLPGRCIIGLGLRRCRDIDPRFRSLPGGCLIRLGLCRDRGIDYRFRSSRSASEGY